jgi:(p)ppGpp synthase/HD superfamily hydrolase
MIEGKYDTITSTDFTSGNLIERAIIISINAHKGQKDKGGHPYILHPLTVMSEVDSSMGKVVAVLHDVIEDTQLTSSDLIGYGIPEEAVDVINILTRRDDEEYEEYITRVSKNEIAIDVKLKDLIHNMDQDRTFQISKETMEKYRKAYWKLVVDKMVFNQKRESKVD